MKLFKTFLLALLIVVGASAYAAATPTTTCNPVTPTDVCPATTTDQGAASSTPTNATAPAAPSSALKSDACAGLSALDAGQSCGSAGSSSGVGKLITTVINILSLGVGIASVIMLIVGGFKYVVSGGESAGVASAKNTIIYALIGLVVTGLAQFLVHFVISRTT